MIPPIDQTHDAALRSWVESANEPGTDFPIQNLPYGVFRRKAGAESPRVGVAIGDQILDLAACAKTGGFLSGVRAAADACCSPSLNLLMALGKVHRAGLRRVMSELLRVDSPGYRKNRDGLQPSLVPMSEAELYVPAHIGDYTDFYASIFHATNVGSMFRPENPLLPNYKYIPIAYHGRSSSIVASGTQIVRPMGQTKDDDQHSPVFGPTRQLDYEVEAGCFVGPGNSLGKPIPIDQAEDHLFGICLVNDWSARDIQKWEYQPLGPFLAKDFATSVSPWVITTDALAPFRTSSFDRPAGDPPPLPHLNSADDREHGGIDLTLEVYLSSQKMKGANIDPIRLSRANFKDMYWTLAQMLTHHASNGCNLRPGDLFASGT
ncbi:MAG TPA: fumarylacetoacetase, partial [Bacteroidota bacterium]|nr:fumarylacetoacetase [Bacteroidota bacterium]